MDCKIANGMQALLLELLLELRGNAISRVYNEFHYSASNVRFLEDVSVGNESFPHYFPPYTIFSSFHHKPIVSFCLHDSQLLYSLFCFLGFTFLQP